MFERFTDRARRVVVLAQEEARLLNHNYIGTEHILLGLVREGEGVAAKAMAAMEISLEGRRDQVQGIVRRGQEAAVGYIPLNPPTTINGHRHRGGSRSAGHRGGQRDSLRDRVALHRSFPSGRSLVAPSR